MSDPSEPGSSLGLPPGGTPTSDAHASAAAHDPGPDLDPARTDARSHWALDNLDEAVTIVDREWRCVYGNPAAARLLGLDPQAMIGRLATELPLGADPAAAHAAWALTMADGEPRRIELHSPLRDGSPQWVEHRVRPCPDGILIESVDVSDRKAAQEAQRASRVTDDATPVSIRDSEAILRRTFEGLDAIVSYQIEPHGPVIVSPQVERILGVHPDALRTHAAWNDLVHPDDFASCDAAWMATGSAWHLEYRMRRADSSWVWVSDRGRRLRPEEQGGPVTLGVVFDITAQRATADALRQSEDQTRRMLEGIDAIVSYQEPGGQPVILSRQVERILGYRPADVAPHEVWAALVHPDDIERCLAAWLQLDEDWEMEYRLRRADGTWAWVADRGLRIRHPDHGEAGMFGIITDITARRELETQLRQAQRLEAVGQLAGGVAHDFNNLLAAITGYSEMVREVLPDGSAGREDIDEVLRAAGRAAALTRQLLAFSRRQHMAREELDPAEVIDQLMPMLARLLGEHIDIVRTATLDEGRVLADRGQLEQVIVNLAVNARDAMPGGGRLTISTASVAVDGHEDPAAAGWMRITVADTGTGMDAVTQARAFEPFFTTKEPGKGTGMGLATVHGIVHQSGGTIEVVSAPGEGTVVTINLPRVATPAAPGSGPLGQTGLPAVVTGSSSVLVVEDDASVRAWITRVLLDCGYRVRDAASGDEALAALAADPGGVDLVVSDIRMPGLQGPELVRRVQAAWPAVRVMLISGLADEVAPVLDVQGSPVGILEKPFDRARLAQAVGQALARTP